MGINSLWTALEPVKKSWSLVTVAVDHRINAQSEGIEGRNKTLTLGVDMGTCIAHCNAILLAADANNQWAGAGLYIFFKMLTEYLKAPVSLIFVLDGAERPPFKHNYRVQHEPVWMMDLAIELVQTFGYQIHQAPGQAEAELAKLNCEGYIHGVISSDSDVILFGTQLLFRNIPKYERDFPDQFTVYTEDAIGLTQGSRVLFALLTGGDYGDGIKGCGPATALALVRCGFGDELLSAFRRLDRNAFDQFLIQWRCRIQRELVTNSLHFLCWSQPKLAEGISDGFPDQHLLDLYINPITSWSPGRNPPHPSQWQFKQPSISELTRFCVQHFDWKTERIIKEKFKSYIWEGIFSQILYSPSVEYISEHKRLQLPNSMTHAEVLCASSEPCGGQILRAYGSAVRPKLVVSTEDFVDAMGLDFSGNSATDNVTVWPSPLLPSQAFHQELGSCPRPNEAHRKNSTLSINAAAIDDEEHEWIQIGEKSWFVDLTSE